MSTFIEAVRAVEHAPTCQTITEGFCSGDFSGEFASPPCDCDRDERIAKGIAGALTEVGKHRLDPGGDVACVCGKWTIGDVDESGEILSIGRHKGRAALAAFVEASR